MRQDRLEEQLLAAIEKRVLTPKMIDYALRRFQEALRKRLKKVGKVSSALPALEEEGSNLWAQAHRRVSASADSGHSPSLLSHLASTEAKLARIDQQIEASKPMNPTVKPAELRSFVLENATRLSTILRAGVTRARAALTKHVRKLVLTPQETDNGSLYAASGQIGLDANKISVMPMVARDGIEPPTPAFSGLRSTPELPGHLFVILLAAFAFCQFGGEVHFLGRRLAIELPSLAPAALRHSGYSCSKNGNLHGCTTELRRPTEEAKT